MDQTQHPLFNLLKHYVDNFSSNRRIIEDLSDLAYQQKYGLTIRPSDHWDWVDVLVELTSQYLSKGPEQKHVDVVYLSVGIYRKFHSALQDFQVSYHPWQDIGFAMGRVSQDVRRLNHYKSRFAVSNLVIAMVPPGFTEIIEQIRSWCPNCLIVIEAMEPENR